MPKRCDWHAGLVANVPQVSTVALDHPPSVLAQSSDPMSNRSTPPEPPVNCCVPCPQIANSVSIAARAHQESDRDKPQVLRCHRIMPAVFGRGIRQHVGGGAR